MRTTSKLLSAAILGLAIMAIAGSDRTVAQTVGEAETIDSTLNSECFNPNSQGLSLEANNRFNQAEMKYRSSDVIGQELKLLEKGDFDLNVNFISESNTFVASSVVLFCPCFPGVGFCCWRQP
ncbi:exported hypothetical protein [Hyella patelloides LEGE 07179]|uniref:Uncharacterized protein n=1 Tax=Hyella patelloides LEGE 07179 TaxID=945734 RepID=A0A563VP37_9CYAN|nr:hypothetical protein [Hyella patelloides]VEP13139.1 exported hypothetical protein [Hyella patelloides LEGE 07179]